MMSGLVIAAVAILLVATIVGLANARAGADRWRLRRTSRTAIERAAPRVLAKLVGNVTVEEKLLGAPLTGRACTCWSLTIDDVGTENGDRLVDRDEGVPFCLTESGVTISVFPLLFRIVPDASDVVTHNFPRDAHSKQFLDQYLEAAAERGEFQGVLAMLRSDWPLRVREMIIREGSTIAALGLVETRADSHQHTNKRVTCPDNGPLLLSDAPSLLR